VGPSNSKKKIIITETMIDAKTGKPQEEIAR
jgi:hypothetical protein